MGFSLKIVLQANLPNLVFDFDLCKRDSEQHNVMLACTKTLASVSVHYSNCVSPDTFHLYFCFFAKDLDASLTWKKKK